LLRFLARRCSCFFDKSGPRVGMLSRSRFSLAYCPLSTAIFGVLRGGERPKLAFWLFSVVGSLAVAGFALTKSSSASLVGDLLMVAAILLCGLGYAEGATLSRRLGGWQVISWALLLALPVMLIFALASNTFGGIGWPVWLSLAYVSCIGCGRSWSPRSLT
jgi:drug/metabolite transporter (DMT)-like permease